MEPLRKAIREGSGAEGVKEVEEAERLNHDVTCKHSKQGAMIDVLYMAKIWESTRSGLFESAENMISTTLLDKQISYYSPLFLYPVQT